MKGRFRTGAIICVALLIALIVVTVLLCKSCADSEEPAHPTIDNASAIYDNAANIVSNTENLSLQISYKKETLLENEFITEQFKQNITYEALGTELVRAQAEETLMVGNHTIDITEVFTENKVYLTVDGCQFWGNMDADAYLARYTPAQPLNAALYNTITGVDTGDGYIITFSDAAAIESWIPADDAAFRQASGSAYIGADGQLTKSVYTAAYAVEDVNIRLSVTVEINYDDVSPVQLPDHTDSYIELAFPDAPRMLEKACGYLLDAASVNATCEDSIFCEAFGDQRKQTVALRTSQGTSWSAQIDTEVEIINSSKSGMATTYTQKELFADNAYSISIDNAAPTTSDDVNIGTMRSYCQDLLVGTIMLPQYITSATITEEDGSFTIEFTGNETFAQLIDAEACTTLYQDDGILRSTAQSYTVDIMTCYLKINKTTGLPIGSGFDYQGIYTIDSLPYRLQFQSDQQYALLNDEAGA